MFQLVRKIVRRLPDVPYLAKRYLAEISIARKQNKLIRKEFSPDLEQLIVFIVPGADLKTGEGFFSGGVMSIFSLAEESQAVQASPQKQVIICTPRKSFLYIKNKKFENSQNVYRFDLLTKYFKALRTIIIHIPEIYVIWFHKDLNNTSKQWLASISKVHINILNQNIKQVPAVQSIQKLKNISSVLTMTTAHVRYTTPHYRAIYGIPLHLFSARTTKMSDYIIRNWEDKEDMIIVSPDKHPMREQVLAALSTVEGLHVKIIQNIPYAEYKKLIAKAKWGLTFGEGLDGYFGEPILCGGISFAVYNDDFFPKNFKSLPTVYQSYEEMARKITLDIQHYNNVAIAKAYNNQLHQIITDLYSDEGFRKNIENFYAGKYSLP